MHTKKKTKLYILIFASLFFSFATVHFITPKVFLANTPEPNPDFIASVQKSPLAVASYIGDIQEGASLKDHLETAKMPRATPPEGINFTPLAQGVWAAEDEKSGRKYIKIKKGTKIEVYAVVLSDGRQVQVYVPVE